MNKIEKIRQEIERRKKENMYDDLPITIGRYYEDRDLLAFIDSLPEETCKDSLQVPETCKENTDSFTSEPKDLEEAADEYSEKHGFRVPYDGSNNFYDEVDVKASKEGFIAGAKWKANQLLKGSPLPEDTVLFQKGVEEGRRLEMDDLALTWEDMAKIDAIILDVNNEFAVDYTKEIDRQKFYEEVLKRFKEGKK